MRNDSLTSEMQDAPAATPLTGVDWDAVRREAERAVEARGFGVIGAELYGYVLRSGATHCEIAVEKRENEPLFDITIKHDGSAPAELAQVWEMLLPPSAEQASQDKRLTDGKGFVLALSRSLKIKTAAGTVEYDADGCREYPRRKVRQRASIEAVFELDYERLRQLRSFFGDLVPPEGLTLDTDTGSRFGRWFSGITAIRAALPTEPGDRGGTTRRFGVVQLGSVREGEKATLFEHGVPVIATGDDHYHYNVAQPVPLHDGRASHKLYIRRLRALTLNWSMNCWPRPDASSEWVRDAASDEACSSEAFLWWLATWLGVLWDKPIEGWLVAATPGDPQADRRAVENSYKVLDPGLLTVGQHLNLNRLCPLRFSREVFGDGRSPYDGSPGEPPDGIVEVGGVALIRVTSEQWTRKMQAVSEFARVLAHRLLDLPLTLRFVWNPPDLAPDHRPWLRTKANGGGELLYGVDATGQCRAFDGGKDDVVAEILWALGHYATGVQGTSGQSSAPLARIGAGMAELAVSCSDFYLSLGDEVCGG